MPAGAASLAGELNPLGLEADAGGALAGTRHTGLLLTEAVRVERKGGGVWSEVAASVPATLEPVSLRLRSEMETWTHKPLVTVWLLPATDLEDGDRLVRADGERWYVRGAPARAATGTHMAALAERATEDGLFAAYDAAEPA
jgi:hypothetical protein